MASIFDYIFNIGGNYTAKIKGMSEVSGDFSAEIRKSTSAAEAFTGVLARFDYAKNVVQNYCCPIKIFERWQ